VNAPSHPYVLAITGASGAIIAVRLLQQLARTGQPIHLSISTSGQAVIEQELGLRLDLQRFAPAQLLDMLAPEQIAARAANTAGTAVLQSLVAKDARRQASARTAADAATPSLIHYHHHADFLTPIASGSFRTAGMIVCPCSGSTLGGIAHGSSSNLIQRAADVHLKERRPLILVPRETPLSVIQLENMQRLAQAGAIILPAMPGWYHGVESVADLIDFVVARILDQLQIEHQLTKRWGATDA
jgi:4-hydroxy-3-polyprenylbenzoate decarboxylase